MAANKDTIEAIYNAALHKPAGTERSACLDTLCANDPKLRARVEQLLAAHDKAGDFLERPVFNVGITMDDSPLSEGPGAVIGPYKLLERIGEGGMAVVYMAEQEKPIRRRIALKVIKLGMDTKSVIARFEAERQALAMMDHPNIARVLDAGAAETGRPYFVMDLVPGLPITEYCDKNRLGIEERLGLFICVCNAVQHAHQKGIIHRDIKPSNILVTQHDGKPVPKVIDFGIAKATNQRLTEKTLFTRHAHMIGTPAYMSPEQAELSDLDVDTRTDIYSLGILLYELLTGSTPFSEEQLREAGYLQMQKIICETEPTKPSTKLSTLGEALTDVAKWHNCSPESMPKLVRGDLDWIVMKSLEKDRTRRYDTASALGMDIQRHLNNEPVQAAAPSIPYKLRKFLKRHRVAVATGSVVAAALLIVAVVSAVYVVNAERANREIAGLLAGSYVDQAQALCEQGHVGRGMLWLARSLQIAPPGSDDLDRAIRTSLAAWHGQLHSLATVVQYPAPAPVTAVTFTPDGSQILAARRDGVAEFCDAFTGQLIGRPIQHGRAIWVVAISPDGARIATGSQDGSARLWDASTLEPIGEVIRHGELSHIRFVFSPDSTRLITATRDGVRSWDARTGKFVAMVFEHKNRGVRAITVCPEGIRVVLGVDRGVHQMFDAETGKPVGPPIESPNTYRVAISPDGQRFATANSDGRIRIWEAATGKPALEPILHGGVFHHLAFSPDGSRIVSGGLTRMGLLWDASTGEPIGAPMRQRSAITAMSFSPDGDRVVISNEDGVVQVWNIVRDKYVGKAVKHQDPVLYASCDGRGLRILTRTDGMVQVREALTGRPIGKPFSLSDQNPLVAFFSLDGSLLATTWRTKDTVSLWNVATGEPAGELHHPRLGCFAFSPDGTRILTGDLYGVVRLWSTATLECLREFHQHRKVVSRVRFSPDGSQFLTGSYDGTALLWDSDTLKPIGEPLVYQSEVKSAAFSPDGTRILIGYGDGTIRLWDATTRRPIGTPVQTVKVVCAVAFSPDGSQILAACIDGTTRLWEAASLKPIGPPLVEHDQYWPSASFSPDGSEILLADRYGKAQIWPAPPGPLTGECERIVCWVQVATGMQLDATGGIHVLDAKTWHERRRRLDELGGPPLGSPADFDRRSQTKGL